MEKKKKTETRKFVAAKIQQRREGYAILTPRQDMETKKKRGKKTEKRKKQKRRNGKKNEKKTRSKEAEKRKKKNGEIENGKTNE